MKAVAFNGSARKDGNTALLISRVFQILKAEGIETEFDTACRRTDIWLQRLQNLLCNQE